LDLKKIFPAEFADEVEEILACCQKTGIDPSEIMVVALQPEVRVLCRKKGLDHVDTLPFFDNNSHRRVLMKSHELTVLIRDNLSFNTAPVRENVFMNAFLYYSRFYINHLLWLIEIMTGIEAKYKNHEILQLHRNEERIERSFRADPFLSNRDRFVSSLIGKYCREHRLKMEIVEAESAAFGNENRKNEKKPSDIWTLVLQRLYRIKLKKLACRNTVFITARSYNLDRVCRDVRARFSDVITLANLNEKISAARYLKRWLKESFKLIIGKSTDKRLMRISVEIFNTLDKDRTHKNRKTLEESFERFGADFHRKFVYADCNFWDEFAEKIKRDLLKSLVELWDADSGQKSFLTHLRPNLVISAVSVGEYQNWAEASRCFDIPALIIPQKMLLTPTDPYAKIEESYIGQAQVTESYENAASQSPLVSRYLKWIRYGGKMLETGNMIFSKLDRTTRQEKREELFAEIGFRKKIVVWAPSMKTRRSRRFYILETVDELLDSMKDVFEIIARMPDVHLIFRIHPGGALTKDTIFSLLSVPANVSFSDSGSFENTLAVADLLLSFSSTTILESLMNQIPVLLYDRWKRYNHLDAPRVDDSLPKKMFPVYYVDEIENLSPNIQWILREHGKGNDHSGLFKEYVHETRHADKFFDFVARCLPS
jgi:hypothetical protein